MALEKSSASSGDFLPPFIVMGVSGCGKSTVGALLAGRLGFQFVDGDDLHSPQSIAQMSAGVPLTDRDRGPWLGRVANVCAGGGVVVACSALKRSYRDRIRSIPGTVFFLHLTGSKDAIAGQLHGRDQHFMPESLLDSQIASLEPLEADEVGIELDVHLPLEEKIQRAVDASNTAQSPKTLTTPKLDAGA